MNKEETLLTSDKSQEVPKIKLALEEKYEKEKKIKSILTILLKKKKLINYLNQQVGEC
jgi:hypothetical protein